MPIISFVFSLIMEFLENQNGGDDMIWNSCTIFYIISLDLTDIVHVIFSILQAVGDKHSSPCPKLSSPIKSYTIAIRMIHFERRSVASPWCFVSNERDVVSSPTPYGDAFVHI